MKKIYKILSSIIAFTLLLCFCLTSCKEQEDEKYDVTIKITNNFGSEWIFTPDASELTYEFEYTGEEMYFYIDSYNLPEHPRWSDKWFTPSNEGADVFHQTMTYRAPDDKKIAYTGPVKEKGEYCICVVAGETSEIWNFRAVYLYVNVI